MNDRHTVSAAEVTAISPDLGHLQRMIEATRGELEKVGVTETPKVTVADSGYWNEEQIDNVVSNGIPGADPAPMPASATHRAAAGMAGATPSCEPCSPVTTAAAFTENARLWSSPYSLKPSTIGASTSSSDEADPPHAPNGA